MNAATARPSTGCEILAAVNHSRHLGEVLDRREHVVHHLVGPPIAAVASDVVPDALDASAALGGGSRRSLAPFPALPSNLLAYLLTRNELTAPRLIEALGHFAPKVMETGLHHPVALSEEAQALADDLALRPVQPTPHLRGHEGLKFRCQADVHGDLQWRFSGFSSTIPAIAAFVIP